MSKPPLECSNAVFPSYPGRWGAALDIMLTRNAVLCMSEILSCEEKLGRSDKPILIEKTGSFTNNQIHR